MTCPQNFLFATKHENKKANMIGTLACTFSEPDVPDPDALVHGRSAQLGDAAAH